MKHKRQFGIEPDLASTDATLRNAARSRVAGERGLPASLDQATFAALRQARVDEALNPRREPIWTKMWASLTAAPMVPAMCALLAALGTLLWHPNAGQPRVAGALEFAQGYVEVVDAERRSTVHQGGTTHRLVEQSLIRTEEDEGCLIQVGDSTQGAVRESTELQIASAAELRLDHGEIWLSVAATEPVRVRTPHGLVEASIADFGVRVDTDTVEILMAQGSASLTVANAASSQAHAGERLTYRDGAVALTKREPTRLNWVGNLIQVAAGEFGGDKLPSLKP